ncbi:hypothetical protein GS444_06235 [Rhodococcus hoagii]|nr:hypothetical protein [Prescottella equi]
MTTTETPRRRTYGGLHEAPTTYLFGVSKKTFYVFATGVGIGILLMLFGFWLFGAVVLALVLLAWAPLAIRFGGRSGYEYMSVLLGWRKQTRRGQHILRAGTLSNQPGGRTRLPGIGATTEMWWGIDKLGRRFGMIHMPARHQYTIRLRCSVPGFAGVEQEQIDLDVANWGEFVNVSGQTGDIEAVVTVVETIRRPVHGRPRRSRACASPAPPNSRKLSSANPSPTFASASSCTPTWPSRSGRPLTPSARTRWR